VIRSQLKYDLYLDRLERTYLRTSPAYALQSYYLLALNLYNVQDVERTWSVLNRVEQGGGRDASERPFVGGFSDTAFSGRMSVGIRASLRQALFSWVSGAEPPAG
jgi:hypothetical protein